MEKNVENETESGFPCRASNRLLIGPQKWDGLIWDMFDCSSMEGYPRNTLVIFQGSINL